MDIPVLMYHAVHPDRSVVSIHPDLFADQMAWLNENGYRTISQQDLSVHLLTNQPLPYKCVALTFDDGYQSVYENAFPILKKYNYSATVFLIADYCGKDNDWPGQLTDIPRWPLLDWAQIREMDSYGVEFGAHSFSHSLLDTLEQPALTNEISLSKQIIEEQIGHPVHAFAYPYGRVNAAVKYEVSQFFNSACSTRLGLVTQKSDRFELERIEIAYLNRAAIFHNMEQRWFPQYLRLRSVIRKIGGFMLHRQWY